MLSEKTAPGLIHPCARITNLTANVGSQSVAVLIVMSTSPSILTAKHVSIFPDISRSKTPSSHISGVHVFDEWCYRILRRSESTCQETNQPARRPVNQRTSRWAEAEAWSRFKRNNSVQLLRLSECCICPNITSVAINQRSVACLTPLLRSLRIASNKRVKKQKWSLQNQSKKTSDHPHTHN